MAEAPLPCHVRAFSAWGFADKDLRTLGIRGTSGYYGDDPKKGKEVTFRWDDKTKTYLGSVRDIPLPKKPTNTTRKK